MNDRFDELAKSLAQSVTRRGALEKFGLGLAGVVLASLGLANKAEAGKGYTCCHYTVSCYEQPSGTAKLCVPAGESCPSYDPTDCRTIRLRAQPVSDCSRCK